MARQEISFSIEKERALKLAKKAATQKFAIMKDSGFTFKVGAPMMTATIEVGDGVITVTGTPVVANTVVTAIQDALDELANSSSSGNSAPVQNAPRAFSIEEQLKTAEALKVFKELYDNGVLTEEEFKAKKQELLNASSGVSNQVNNKETATVHETSDSEVEMKEIPSPCDEGLLQDDDIEAVEEQIDEQVKEENQTNTMINDETVEQVDGAQNREEKASTKYLDSVLTAVSGVVFFVLFMIQISTKSIYSSYLGDSFTLFEYCRVNAFYILDVLLNFICLFLSIFAILSMVGVFGRKAKTILVFSDIIIQVALLTFISFTSFTNDRSLTFRLIGFTGIGIMCINAIFFVDRKK